MAAILGDFIVGFAFGQVTMFAVGLWSLLIGVLTGVLWVLGGSGYLGTKVWRRLFVPIIICLPFMVGHYWGAIGSVLLQCSWHTVGYGEPDANDPTGSWLGRKLGHWTRPVWILIYALTLIPLSW